MSPPSDYRRALRPPQFTLRTLIGLITLLAALFSLVNVVHPVVMAGLVLLALLIAAHVAGNVIGTRLREIGDRPVTKEGREVPPRPCPARTARTLADGGERGGTAHGHSPSLSPALRSWPTRRRKSLLAQDAPCLTRPFPFLAPPPPRSRA